MAFQRVIVQGTIRKLERKSDSMVSISIPVDRKYTSKDGEKVEETEWFNCTLFGKTAEVVESYLGVGDPILVEGRMATRKMEDGRQFANLIVERFNFVGAPSAEKVARPSPKKVVGSDVDDDIPF